MLKCRQKISCYCYSFVCITGFTNINIDVSDYAQEMIYDLEIRVHETIDITNSIFSLLRSLSKMSE